MLEPLADALGLSVIELLHGRRENVDAEHDMQVREAIRIAGAATRENFRRVWQGVKICLAIFLTYRQLGGTPDGPLFYYQAEIDGQEAWNAVTDILWELPLISLT